MANEKNLKPSAHHLTVEEQSKGGQNSAKARREKKKVRALLEQVMDGQVKKSPHLSVIADALGLERTKSVKELAVLALLANTIKKGDINDLEKIEELLGERSDGVGDDGGINITLTIKDLSEGAPDA
ncbi:MAG: hypothetical protein IJ515_03780 [Clostridia bacterium]|nr:hypothetical protein [Clostridia bacterium]